jgi:hypothetical protein
MTFEMEKESMAEKNLEAAIRTHRTRLRAAIAQAANPDGMSLRGGIIAGLYADIEAMEKHLERKRTKAEMTAFYDGLERERSAIDGTA